jgi:hypothetical protein
LALLRDHAPELSVDTLRNPRIVIMAGDFSPKVTTAAVWLSERGVDIALTRVQAYQSAHDRIITVSQVWPPPKVEDFVVAPSRTATAAAAQASVEVEWTPADLGKLVDLGPSLTILTLMDLCAARPGAWIGGDEIYGVSGRAPGKHRGELAGFGNTIKSRFARSNAPWEAQYAQGEIWQQYYSLSAELAQAWRSLRGEAQPAEEGTPQ